jgi:hypothetical protein
LGAYLRDPTYYYLSFVFLATLIWLLHCNAMHFDSFSLGARHLFQKFVSKVSVIFFMSSYTCDTLLFLELKSLPELLKKSM